MASVLIKHVPEALEAPKKEHLTLGYLEKTVRGGDTLS